MTERNASRPWTEEEDALLKEGVARYGEQDSWKTIALSIPDRSNKACRKRWLHSLSPNVKKCAWSHDEDELLLKLYDELGPKWSTIARSISGRTDDACSKRYREALDPSLKKDGWTPEEDEKLTEAYNRMGGKWMKVGQELGRSGLGCRNRWRLLERKRAARANQEVAMNLRHVVEPEAGTQPVQPFTPPEEPSGMSSIPLEDTTTNWPPYYPPEMYVSLLDGDTHPVHAFREPTPEVTVSPHIAPFQFSSSSLSAALSAPPHSRPLPPENSIITHTNYFLPVSHSQSQPQSQSTSPLVFDGPINANDDISMSLDDLPDTNMDQYNSRAFFQSNPFSGHFSSAFSFPIFHESSIYNSVSPISPSVLTLPVDPLQFDDAWKSPQFSAMFSAPLQDASPSLLQTSISSTSETLDDISSTSSTPFPTSTPISPTSSPNSDIQVDLSVPFADTSASSPAVTGGSLLFSVPSPHPQPARKRRKVAPKSKPEALIRLSSNLRLSADPNLRPYACGHESCWSADEDISHSCFSTSKELFDHSRDQHPPESNCEKPFRCGLEGCGKSWKSINGLQYHLQISAAHFKNALQSRFSAQKASGNLDECQQGSGTSSEQDSEDTNRIYTCPKPHCFKAYRQPSGLRYHMKHGHPAEMPVQLPEVPPVLERELPNKTKKMRRKASPEPVMA